MAQISRFLWWRHLRAEQSSHVLRWRRGQLTASGRGLGFVFFPWNASIAEIPVDDRELPFLVRVPTVDFQEANIQGTVHWRVADPELLAQRFDFSLDLSSGRFNEDPLEALASSLGSLVRQLAEAGCAGLALKDLLARGTEPIRTAVMEGLRRDEGILDMGLEIVAVRVASIRPEAKLERALQMPTRERIQEEADEATFRRRAQAVEKERAIQENELQNQIELATREQQLVAQRGANERRRVQEEVESLQIASEAGAARSRLEAEAEADRIRSVEGASLALERERMDVYAALPPPVLLGLAARALAENLDHIDHVHVSPDLLGPLLGRLVEAGTARLEEG